MVSCTFRCCVTVVVFCCTSSMISTHHRSFAASFSAIQVIDNKGYGIPAYAAPGSISPDGFRVVGGIEQPGVIYDCGGAYSCTSSFSWERNTGVTIGNIASFPDSVTTAFGERKLFASNIVSASQGTVLVHAEVPYGYTGPMILTSDGPVRLGEETYSRGIRAEAMSDDGGVVVGVGVHGFRWTVETGIKRFGSDSEGRVLPSNISGDGQTIIGLTYETLSPYLRQGETDHRAFHWTESTGFLTLPEGPEERRFTPAETSSDGSIVVGDGYDRNRRDRFHLTSLDPPGLLENRALIWTEEAGTELLELPTEFKSTNVAMPKGTPHHRTTVGKGTFAHAIQAG